MRDGIGFGRTKADAARLPAALERSTASLASGK
jgi:hypothetical protein